MISVVIATYNGSKYILIQLQSILVQLGNTDEIIIIDDCSTDNTILILQNIADSRIKIIQNPINLGHVKSFEKGLAMTKGDVIFLSDQDDYWLPNKVDLMTKYLSTNKLDLLISSYYISLEQGKITRDLQSQILLQKSNRITNLISLITGKNNYLGSLMCIKATSLHKIIPFPNMIEAHDLYIALKLNLIGSVGHLEYPLVIRTITGHNLTNPNRSLFNKIKSRIILLRSIFQSIIL